MLKPRWCIVLLAAGSLTLVGGCGTKGGSAPSASLAADEIDGRFAEPATSPYVSPIVAVACSADGGRLISAGANGSVWLWNAETGEPPHRFDRTRPLSAALFLPDGRRALFVGPALDLIDLQKHAVEKTFSTEREKGLTPGMREAIAARCAAMTPDGRLLAAGRADNRVEVWEVESGTLLAEFQEIEPQFDGADEGIVAVGISADGATVAAVDARCHVWQWDLVSRQRRASGRVEVLAAASYTQTAAFSGDCNRLLVSVQQRSSSTVQIVEVTPGGGEGGQVDAASSLAVWDVTGNKVLHVLQSPGASQVRGLCISADGRRAAAGLDEGIAVWELETGQRSADFSGHRGAVLAAAFSSDGRWLVTGGQDYSARRWRLPE